MITDAEIGTGVQDACKFDLCGFPPFLEEITGASLHRISLE